MNVFFAFLHHLAAFGLVSTLVLELVLLKGEISGAVARKLQGIDMAFGICAGLVLAIGLARVFYFEKGADYYLHNAAFHGKVGAFVLVGLLSIYPTVKFLSWAKAAKRGEMPVIQAGTVSLLRKIVHVELVGVVAILLCAAMMARGVGAAG